MKMEESKTCNHCNLHLELCVSEGLDCSVCSKSVHLKCLDRGTVPGGLNGDVFFTYTCKECSPMNEEIFIRNKLSWLQAIVLVFYHMQTKNSGLARRGYFHWRNHIACFIEKHWDVLFTKDSKKKKKLQGTIAGMLSHFSTFFFQSGTATFNEPAWWTLTYPKLTPSAISNIYSTFSIEKQKLKQEKAIVNDTELFQKILSESIEDKNLLTRFTLLDPVPVNETSEARDSEDLIDDLQTLPSLNSSKHSKRKRKRILPSFSIPNKCSKAFNSNDDFFDDSLTSIKQNEAKSSSYISDTASSCSNSSGSNRDVIAKVRNSEKITNKFLDRFCYYNTSLKSQSKIKGVPLKIKLLGGIREGQISSPYSAISLKPYIWRDIETFPPWLKVMTQIQLKCNQFRKDYIFPPRACLDYVYVQPDLIPAINSLCNEFFWPGIDLTETLRYPEFSCVVLYKRLIVAFAFIIPNVSYTENYLSFIFTRPGWRNVGIAKRMVYFLLQISLGKDITLHVPVNNSAMFLFQKFGFKVEKFEEDFYKNYISDTCETKHAFFCRLRRSNL